MNTDEEPVSRAEKEVVIGEGLLAKFIFLAVSLSELMLWLPLALLQCLRFIRALK